METKNNFYIKEGFTMKSAFKRAFGYTAGLMLGLCAANLAITVVDDKLPEKYKNNKDEKKEA